ncbi:MAG: hypothetical protein JKY00_14735 [Roseicyclus sp.]|nr:hypothetical protein [Roseicyclus sp.]
MKPLVIRPIEDWSGQRCIDLRREADALFFWAECWRDPEDGHGWHPLGVGAGGFASEAEVLADAKRSVGLMEGN